MKKIISLFKRNYTGDRLVYDEIVPGAEWVTNGEGKATLKIDGTCCLVRDGKLFKRYDRKLTKSAKKRKRRDSDFVPSLEHFKAAPTGWKAAETDANKHTGHWPGWLPVGEGPQDQWHREGFELLCSVGDTADCFSGADGTYELVGPKIQGNPYVYNRHVLLRHGDMLTFELEQRMPSPITFNGLREFFRDMDGMEIEGIVWHHPDGRMVKIKRKDFGYNWPPTND